MSAKIARIDALEILDSRGRPTLRARVTLANGVRASASVPSGASTGTHEAVELRDRDARRYGGAGVLAAVEKVERVIAPALVGTEASRQADIDGRMLELDGTSNKSNLGANSILAVSQACARAAARAARLPLYAYLGGVAAPRLPMPMINVVNGGRHADNGLEFQEFMIVPVGATSFADAIRHAAETFQSLGRLLRQRGLPTAVGDEGGFAPRLECNEAACELIVEAIEAAGFRPGSDVAIALDPAATSFYRDGKYHLSREGAKTSVEMTALYQDWIRRFPIVSIEDGLAESDWNGFREQTEKLGAQVQIVGDDILVTNPRFIARAIEERACNAALIKLNQIGTVTETVEAVALCRRAGWGYVISHRSGETEDTFMADFAVAMGGGQMKAGSVCRGERIAKYNRLLEIERELGGRARFGR